LGNGHGNAIWGRDGNDTIHGRGGNDSLYGQDGDDVLYGQWRDDELYGHAGNDILNGGHGADLLHGGSGVDRASYTQANSGVRADLMQSSTNSGEAAGDTYRSIEDLQGSKHNDMLFGHNGANSLWGGQGRDELRGRGGSDKLYGQNGNDELYGQNGNDVLYGNSGNDRLVGGNGDDILWGGQGRDTFVLNTLNGLDRVKDFSVGQDQLDIGNILDGYDATQDAISDFVRITESNGNSHVRINADGQGNDFTRIAILDNTTGLTNEQDALNKGWIVT